MKPNLKVKVIGAREEIHLVITSLESDFYVRATSPFIPEKSLEGGVLIYLSLIPKNWGET